MKAFLFPGQGSQKLGMGKDLFDIYREHVEKANDLLGYCIKTLCLSDHKKQLSQTQFTQPALYVVNCLSYLNIVEDGSLSPDFVAGHSLGEYSALFAAQVFSFEYGLQLVKKRAEIMAQSTGGAMAAVIDCTLENVEEILHENSLDSLDVANINGPLQTIISGPAQGIADAEKHFHRTNAKFYRLNVSGAFHSRYMRSAADAFLVYLKKHTFIEPKIPVISNVYAEPYRGVDMANTLASQISSPVRWFDIIKLMINKGVDEFIEIGPGATLSNLQKKIINYLKEHSDIGESDRKKIDSSLLPNAIVKDRVNELGSAAAQDKLSLHTDDEVFSWNKKYPVGSNVKFAGNSSWHETRSKAMVLFKNRPVVYLKGYKGYFSLAEIIQHM